MRTLRIAQTQADPLILRNMHGRLTGDPFLVAVDLGFKLHMRSREGVYMRGKHIWYDGRSSLERQRAMLRDCIERHYRLPMRKVNASRRHNAA